MTDDISKMQKKLALKYFQCYRTYPSVSLGKQVSLLSKADKHKTKPDTKWPVERIISLMYTCLYNVKNMGDHSPFQDI